MALKSTEGCHLFTSCLTITRVAITVAIVVVHPLSQLHAFMVCDLFAVYFWQQE